MARATLYVDMDNVMVDFSSGIARLDPELATTIQLPAPFDDSA